MQMFSNAELIQKDKLEQDPSLMGKQNAQSVSIISKIERPPQTAPSSQMQNAARNKKNNDKMAHIKSMLSGLDENQD